MKATVKATYFNGTITPEFALDLEEGDEVTLTVEAVMTARERIEREKRQRSVQERARQLTVIGRRCARLLKDGPSAVEHADWLYDENGLPK